MRIRTEVRVIEVIIGEKAILFEARQQGAHVLRIDMAGKVRRAPAQTVFRPDGMAIRPDGQDERRNAFT